MEKRMAWVTVSLLVFTASIGVRPAQADEFSELKSRFETLQKEMAALQERLGKLEAERVAASAPPGEMKGARYPAGLLTIGGAQLGLGGTVELEFVDTSKDNSTGEPEPHLLIDKIVLEPELLINDRMSFAADLQFEEDSFTADEYYFTFEGLPLKSKLRIGKDDRLFKPDERLTERYPLAGRSFWKDEEVGIVLKTKGFLPFYSVVSWAQGLELDEDDPNEDDSASDAYAMIEDDTRTSAFNGMKQRIVGIGYQRDFERLGKVDLLGFGLFGQLSRADRTFLAGRLQGYTSTSDRQRRIGVNLDYTWNDFNLFAHYLDAKDGKLNRHAWYLQPSYQVRLPFRWRYANAHRLLFRYDRYGVDHFKQFADPESWTRRALTFAVLSDIVKDLTLKTEYTVNDEKTGAGDIDNNEFVMLLKYDF